jgi:diacylglycerol kinase
MASDDRLKFHPLPNPPPEYRERREEGDQGREKTVGGPLKTHNVLQSFGFAFAGIWYLVRTQRNVRIEVGVGVGVCLAAGWLPISLEDWAILVLTIGVVLVAEALNTAIEVAVDLAKPQRHPLAKIAKDVAAGMVLLAAIAAAVVGFLILGPGVWHRLVK